MSDLSDAFRAKAAERLAGAISEFGNGRYINDANRAYYAAFQAAIAALELAGIRSQRGPGGWDHGFVQAQFAGVLIGRRKLYASVLRDVLSRTQQLRNQADYERADVSQTQAARSLARARSIVEAVVARATEGSGLCRSRLAAGARPGALARHGGPIHPCAHSGRLAVASRKTATPNEVMKSRFVRSHIDAAA